MRGKHIALVVIAIGVALFAYYSLGSSNSQGVIKADQIPPETPVFQIIEGKPGYAYPYYPSVLHIPAGKLVVIRLTDNIGGCGLETVFPGLGVDGGDARVTLPVGKTAYVELLAPHPGAYTYHCGINMYYGTIIAK